MRGHQHARAAQPRRFHKKSKGGCKNCKERRVKCDEKKPICSNCKVHYIDPEFCNYNDKPTSTASSTSAGTELRPIFASLSPAVSSSHGGNERESVKQKFEPSQWILETQLAGGLDPFQSHPECEERDFSNQGFNMFPFSPVRGVNPVTEFYLPLVWSDSLLFHVTLLLGAHRLQLRGETNSNGRVTKLKLTCMRLLKHRISGSLEDGISDATLSAVAGLAAIEGVVRLLNVHMNGLRRILDVRGGLKAVRETNSIVAMIVFCTFLCAHGEPFYQADEQDLAERPTWISDMLVEVEPGNFIDFKEFGVRNDVAELMVNIRLLSSKNLDAASCVTARHYQSVLIFMSVTLQRILNTPLRQSTASTQDALATACCYAMLVHTLTPWRGQQPDPSLTISHAIDTLLKALRVLLVVNLTNVLVLWLLSVAAVSTSVVCPIKYKWCINQLADVTAQMGIQSWETMRAALQQVIWNSSQDETRHQLVWEDVLVRRLEDESE